MFFTKLDGEKTEVFNATAELLKLIIRRVGPKQAGERVTCFHSWRSVIAGVDRPLDDLELAFFKERQSPQLHLVSNVDHIEFIQRQLGHPAVLLPQTVFQDGNVYRDMGLEREFDIFFSCMFDRPHLKRKNVDLLLNTIERFPHLRVAWVGGYHPYERWLMEDAYNKHIAEYGPSGVFSDEPWQEYESSLCWLEGGGHFAGECAKQEVLYQLLEETSRRGLKIQFYANLTREQVVHLISRCGVAVTLSTADQWPRCICEPLACGTPVVVNRHLISGTQVVNDLRGRLADPNPASLFAAIEAAASLNRQEVRESYYQEYGLEQAARSLVAAVEREVTADWLDIVSVQRPAETEFKRSLRQRARELYGE